MSHDRFTGGISEPLRKPPIYPCALVLEAKERRKAKEGVTVIRSVTTERSRVAHFSGNRLAKIEVGTDLCMVQWASGQNHRTRLIFSEVGAPYQKGGSFTSATLPWLTRTHCTTRF